MDISGYNENAKLFFVRKMDWGLEMNRGLDGRPIRDDTWTVYANGHVHVEKEKFPFETNDTFSVEDFKKFCVLLDEFPQVEDDQNGCDGMGYEMILYNEKGGVIHKFCGYIYAISCLKNLMEYLEEF